ncbi:MAG: ABC transporter permease [Gemmatimonadetes bacterium]|nr:ABC transporter permease [Gemmatimonadota bacterium]
MTRVLPRRDRTLLLEEFDRLWERRVHRDGLRAARAWYRRETLAFATRWPLERFRRTTTTMGEGMMDGIRQLRHTVRGLARVPGFTAVAVATLAIGIGANAVIFGIVDRALLRSLPLPESDRVVQVFEGWFTNLATVEILQGGLTTVTAIGAANDAGGRTLEPADGPARRVTVAEVSPEYFEALGVVPRLGRLFAREESEPGRGGVAVVSAAFWRTALGGTAGALDGELVLDGVSHAIVGVLPEGFDFPSARNDVWVPVVMDASNPGLHWGNGSYSSVARMAPGVTPAQVLGEVMAFEETMRLANPLWTPNPGFWEGARVTPLQEARARWVQGPLTVLLAAVAVVLLVVCANVANLLLSRGLARGRALAVRSALGAGGGRLAREQLMESAVLAMAGLAVGLLLASWSLSLIRPHLPAELPGAAQVGLDPRVVIVTAGIALVTALIAGLLPAVRAARGAPAAALRQSGRGGGASRSRRRTTRVLVAAQMAAAVVLVVSAGLLARSLFALQGVDPGFVTDSRVTARVHLAPGLSGDPAARAVLLDDLAAALSRDPALGGVALASTIPFGSEDEYMATFIPGVTDDPNELPMARHHRVTPSFFEVAGIPLLRGRGLADTDRVGSPLVAVVDETFAQTFFPGEDPIGRIVRYPWRGAPDIEVVGVVGSTRHGDLADEREATFWVPLGQMGLGPIGHAVVVAEATGEPSAALGAVTARVRGLDDRMAVSELLRYEERLGASLAGTRLMAVLLLVFAVTALALGCVGVYGVAAFSVREKLREIGVRMAMGASTAGIRKEVLREGLLLAVPGGVLGLILAWPATRLLEGLLFGVARLDPVTFIAVPLILSGAALLAVVVPAHRATRVDPAVVLRGDG